MAVFAFLLQWLISYTMLTVSTDDAAVAHEEPEVVPVSVNSNHANIVDDTDGSGGKHTDPLSHVASYPTKVELLHEHNGAVRIGELNEINNPFGHYHIHIWTHKHSLPYDLCVTPPEHTMVEVVEAEIKKDDVPEKDLLELFKDILKRIHKETEEIKEKAIKILAEPENEYLRNCCKEYYVFIKVLQHVHELSPQFNYVNSHIPGHTHHHGAEPELPGTTETEPEPETANVEGEGENAHHEEEPVAIGGHEPNEEPVTEAQSAGEEGGGAAHEVSEEAHEAGHERVAEEAGEEAHDHEPQRAKSLDHPPPEPEHEAGQKRAKTLG